MSDVTLITPTGDRHASFALLERWIARQTLSPVMQVMQWIVVDDGGTPTPCTADQCYVRRARTASDPRHTLPCNLLAALPHVDSNFVLIIEDDEWYAPEYVSFMLQALQQSADLVGLRRSHYWCLQRRAWLELVHPRHASLCRTGFTRCAFGDVERACAHMSAGIDLLLWRALWGPRAQLLDEAGNLNVSIKNVPGRQRHSRLRGWTPDPHCEKLIAWSNVEVADAYVALDTIPTGEFDEAFYLGLYPDVANAVLSGRFASGRHHFKRHGAAEGRHFRMSDLVTSDTSAHHMTLPTTDEAISMSVDPIAINVVGYFRTAAGMSIHAKRIGNILEASLPVCYLNCRRHHHVNQVAEQPIPTAHGRGDTTLWCTDIRHYDREYHALGQRQIAVWMWELEHTPPRGLGLAEECVREVWAFSRFMQRAFSKWCRKPVYYVPPFVVPPSKPVEFAKDPRFTVLFVFDAASVWERKNPLAVVKVFKAAFRHNEPVRLVVKIMRPHVRREAFAALVREGHGWPIHWLTADLSEIEQWKLMASADCYISLHRSEGIGLTLAEASWCAVPIIATGYGGNTDWLDDSCSVVVPHRLVENDNNSGPYPAGALWAEPDQDFATVALRHMYSDHEWRSDLSAKVLCAAKSKLSPAATSAAMLARIMESS